MKEGGISGFIVGLFDIIPFCDLFMSLNLIGIIFLCGLFRQPSSDPYSHNISDSEHLNTTLLINNLTILSKLFFQMVLQDTIVLG